MVKYLKSRIDGFFFFFKQKTASKMRISNWSSDVCSSDLPVVSTLYRAITGDESSPHARILGDTLFGGPTGFLSSIANVLYEEIAGEDVGETMLALFSGEDGDGDGDGGEPQFEIG